MLSIDALEMPLLLLVLLLLLLKACGREEGREDGRDRWVGDLRNRREGGTYLRRRVQQGRQHGGAMQTG